jgi:hypothetical protein
MHSEASKSVQRRVLNLESPLTGIESDEKSRKDKKFCPLLKVPVKE